MLKINESVDQNLLRTTLEQAEKDGFSRLESHRKNLILNASAIPPFDSKASQPTEFHIAFLAKKSLFKATDFLVHRFTMDQIAFNPGTSFISGLWNSDFFWTLPDTPSGVCIFFCPETNSLNAAELEKEKTFALADKVKAEDLNKISKQKMYLASDIMDLVWMTQNFHGVISLIYPFYYPGLPTCMIIG